MSSQWPCKCKPIFSVFLLPNRRCVSFIATGYFHTPHEWSTFTPNQHSRLYLFEHLSRREDQTVGCRVSQAVFWWLQPALFKRWDLCDSLRVVFPFGHWNECMLKVKVLLTVAYPMIYRYHLMLVPLCSPSAVTPGYLCLIARLGIVLRRRTDGGERNWHAAIRPAVEGCDWLVSKQRNIFLWYNL